MKIHAFGIGDGCDKVLVENVARNGRGSFSLISDDKSHLVGARIIQALEKAFEPSFQNCKLVISHGTTEITENLGEVFRNQLIYKSMFMPEKDLDSFQLMFAFQDDTDKEHVLKFDRSNLEQVQGDFQAESLYKMAAHREIEQFEIEGKRYGDANSQNRVRIRAISIHYQVLVDETAFVGVIEQNDPITGELKKIEFKAKEENKNKGKAEEVASANAGASQPPPEIARAMANAQNAAQSRGGTRGSGGDPTPTFDIIIENFDEFKQYYDDNYQGEMRDNLVERYYEMDEAIGDFMNEMEDDSMLQCLLNSMEQEEQMKIAQQLQVDFVAFFAKYGDGEGPSEEELAALQKWQEEERDRAAHNTRNRMQQHENERHVVKTFDAVINGQHVDGYWMVDGQVALEKLIAQKSIEDPGVYAELNNCKIALQQGIEPKNVYLTLLALFVFKVQYADRDAELDLIKRKAVTWLQSCGIPDPLKVLRAFTQIKCTFPIAREITIEEARKNPNFGYDY